MGIYSPHCFRSPTPGRLSIRKPAGAERRLAVNATKIRAKRTTNGAMCQARREYFDYFCDKRGFFVSVPPRAKEFRTPRGRAYRNGCRLTAYGGRRLVRNSGWELRPPKSWGART